MTEFDPKEYVEDVESAVHEIRHKIRDHARTNARFRNFKPVIALTLGSGLDKLVQQINGFKIPYHQVPNFPELTAEGHRDGYMIVGFIEGVPVVGLVGRKHFYEVAQEPYGMMQVVFAVHVVASLGAEIYFSTNAVGGLNPKFQKGDTMVIDDHLEYGSMPNPLTGPHLDFKTNVYFQSQVKEYDQELRMLFWEASIEVESGRSSRDGLYVALPGRTYETAATCRVLRKLGVDAVGMSTVPEVIIAANRGMKTLAISVITNVISEDDTNNTSSEEVTSVLDQPEVKERLSKTFLTFFRMGRERGIF